MESDLQTRVMIEEEMRQSFMDYAMSVIISRALPDVRDGLKPVQRRVLYGMFKEGLLSSRKTSKCAGVVGSVLKYFHPHGDMPVYEALVSLAQPWSKRRPLVDGQGNFGSIDGDPPAAYRYTECRLTAAAESLLQDIEQETVDFVANFDDTTSEPVVLPAGWPNLIVNGADGIAVGMATHMPPHNLGEVVDGTVALLRDPELTIDQLMQHISGPDFPTGGSVSGRNAIKAAYVRGRGIIKIAGKTHIETLKVKSREVEAIVITEIPYQVNKARLLEKIAALVAEKSVEGIARLRDESDRTGMRIVVELKRDATSEVVLNQLFKMTPLRTSFGIINLAIVEGRPVVCSLIALLNHFINHRRDVVTRRTRYQLRKAEERMHLLEGFRIALLNLDDVIQLIKSADTPQQASAELMARYQLTAVQAQAILELRLQKLTGMERLAIEKEHGELAREIERLRTLLSEARRIDELIVEELLELRNKFSDARRSTIEEDDDSDFVLEDLIEDEEMVVTVSNRGYAKRTPVSEYRSQRRGGKGVSGASARDDDFIEHLFVASTHNYLLVFTSSGRMHWLKVYEIPEAGRAARGRALVNLLQLREDESVTTILPIREFKGDRYILMATRNGFVKKAELADFGRLRKGGLIACTLVDGDCLIGAAICAEQDHLILATRGGMAIRFAAQGVRSMGRTARGVIGIRLEDEDRVVGMTVVAENEADANFEEARVGADATFLTVCENGYGKRTKLTEYRAQGRGGRGLIDIQTTERNGAVVGVAAVDDSSGLMIITSSGKIIRIEAQDISVIGRNTKGVRLINLEEDEKVVAVAQLYENGDEMADDNASD